MVTLGKGRGRSPSLLLTWFFSSILITGLGAAAPVAALTLGGAVVLDSNGNGIVDAVDTPLPGIAVSVQPATGGVSATTNTGADGRYSFPGLASNNYIVTVGSSPGALNESPASVTVPLTTDRNDIDFLFVVPGLIGGRVISDVNGNGVAEAGEPGIQNVMVALQRLNAQGLFDPVATVSTTADGTFFFPLQPAGTYQVVETNPAGFTSTGASGGSSGNATVVNFDTIRVILNGNQAGAGLRFLDRSGTTVPGGGSISGFVYDDTNGNRTIDPPADLPLPNQIVELRDAAQNLLARSTTDAAGRYAFDSVVGGGTYVIDVVCPPGIIVARVSATPPATVSGTRIVIQNFPTGGNLANNNFLLAPGAVVSPGTPGAANAISGKVFNDLNGDGLVSGGEPGLAGATLSLVSSTGVNFGAQTTDASGEFIFVNLPAGEYSLTETNPGGFVSTGVQPGVGGASVNLDTIRITVTGTNNLFSGQIFLDRSTAVPPPPGNLSSISGSVIRDTNGNGFIDFQDVPISGVRVELRTTLGGFLAQTFTNASGGYAFTNLLPGTYLVVEINPANHVSVNAFPGPGGVFVNADTLQVTTVAGGTSPNNNFLDRLSQVSPTVGSISGAVFRDTNGNNVIDGADAPLGGVTIQLFTGVGTPVAQVTTNLSGAYSFTNLPPGSYRVVELDPANHVSIAAFPGPNGQFVNPNQLLVNVVAGVDSGSNNFLDRLTQVSPTVGSISGAVFLDANGNGFLDGGDTGIANVTVQLFTTNGIPVTATTTGANGAYSFQNLPPGFYLVVETDPAGHASVTAIPGPNAQFVNVNSLQVSVAAGANSGSNNFLDRLAGPAPGPNTISGFAVRDLNFNGVPDNEPGLAGMVVTLRDAFNNPITSVTTNSTGAFSFSGLANGTYILTAAPPAGFTSTNAIVGQGGVRLGPATIRVTTSFGLTSYPGHLFLAGP